MDHKTNTSKKSGDESASSEPHSLDAEMELLGAILCDAFVMAQASGLTPDDFYEHLHCRMFEAMKEFYGRGDAIDSATLDAYFQTDIGYQSIGGKQYLDHLATIRAVPSSVPRRVNLIRDLSQRRRMIRLFEEAIGECGNLDVTSPSNEIAAYVGKELSGIDREASGKLRPIVESVDEVIADLMNRRQGIKDLTVIKTGFNQLARMTGDLRRSNLILIGGRPAMGKTALAISIAQGAAKREHRVLFFSLEMNSIEVGSRLLASATEVKYSDIRNGEVNDYDFSLMQDVRQDVFRDLPILQWTGNATIDQIQSAVTFEKIRSGVDLVVIDYLGLVGMERRNSKVDELGELSRTLKNLATMNEVCIIALHQLSRGLEYRDNKRPMLADLRDSGNLEQDADMVWFVYRQAYYLAAMLEAEKDPSVQEELRQKIERQKNNLEIIVGKNRHGETGTVPMYCDVRTNIITDCA